MLQDPSGSRVGVGGAGGVWPRTGLVGVKPLDGHSDLKTGRVDLYAGNQLDLFPKFEKYSMFSLAETTFLSHTLLTISHLEDKNTLKLKTSHHQT